MRLKLFLAVLFISSGLMADQVDYGSATVAAPWLKMPVSARAQAMGGAYAAVAEGANTQSLNPAGLSRLSSMELTLMHNAWFQSMSVEHVAFGMPLGVSQGAALGLDYLNFGTIDKYDVVNNLPVAEGSFTPTALHLDLGYGRLVAPGVSVGLNGKYISQSIENQASSAFAGDLGLLWKPEENGLAIGLALQNLGSQLDGNSLPQTFVIGGAYGLKRGEDNDIKGVAQIDYPFADSKALAFGLGGEYWYRQMAGFRLGYRAQDRGSLSGLSGLAAGLGGRYMMMELDYTFTAMGDLGNGNLISVTGRF